MRPRQFSDDELAAAARRLFLEHGANLSTAAVAKELGVSPAALFKRVGSKQELILRAMGVPKGMPSWITDIEEGPDQRCPRDQLIELGRRIDGFFAQLMPIVAMAKATGMCPKDLFEGDEAPPPVRAQRAMSRWFSQLGALGRARVGNPDGLSVMFLGGLQARHALRHVFPSYTDGGPSYVETLVDALWAGIRPDGAPASQETR